MCKYSFIALFKLFLCMGKARSFLPFQRLILICAGFLLYGNTLFNGYAIDDAFVTRASNISTRGIRAIPEILTTNYGTDETDRQFDYRPLVKVSFAIEHQLFGVDPGVSHFFNMLLYIVCVLLVFRFLRLFVEDPESKIPFYTALLFAFLPIHTEVAASLKNRDILLCFIFSMLAAIVVLKAHLGKKVILHYVVAGLFTYLAFLAKFDALPFLVILPLIVFIRFNKGLKPLLAGIILFTLVFILNRLTSRAFSVDGSVRNFSYFENPLFFDKSFLARVVALFNCLGFYFVQCAFPFKQACYYGVETLNIRSLSLYGVTGIMLAALIVTGIVYAYKKQKKGLLLGLAMFSASTSMYLNFIRPAVGIVADRFIFFGSLGFCIALVFLLEPYLKKLPVKAVSLVLLTVYGYMAVGRNLEWKNSNSLIGADIKKYPTSSYLNYLYATAVLDTVVENKNTLSENDLRIKTTRMRQYLERSLQISNDYPKALSFLASVLVFMEKDHRAALPVINRALSIQEDPDLIYYKGLCLYETGQRDSSEQYLLKAARMSNTAIPAYRMLMEYYNANGKYKQSIALFKAALQRGLETEVILSGLAQTYWEMGDTLSTSFYCEKTLTLAPENKEVKTILAKMQSANPYD